MIAPLDQPAAISRRRYHAGAGSLLYILTTVFLAIGAINSQNNLLFFAFGIGAGAIIISGFISGPALMGIRIRRDAPTAAEVGRPFEIRYTVQNRARVFPAFALTIRESPEHHPRPDHELPIVACVEHVGPLQSVVAVARATPSTRGVVSLGAFTVSTAFPLGLTRKSVHMHQHRTLIIRPRIVSLRPDLLSRLRARGPRLAGARPIAGHGDEFIGLRDYSPGDSPRTVAWRASARAGTLLVRQTAVPAPARLWIHLHPSLAEATPHEQEIGVTLAASVAALADQENYAVGLRGFGVAVLPRPGRRSIERVMDALAEARISHQTRRPAEPTPPSDAVILITRSRADGDPAAALVVPVSEAGAFLAPGASLPEPPPPAQSRFQLAFREFLGLENPPSPHTRLAGGAP